MTKKEKQLFDTMMAAMREKNARELDFIIANREYEEARRAYLDYEPEVEAQWNEQK